MNATRDATSAREPTVSVRLQRRFLQTRLARAAQYGYWTFLARPPCSSFDSRVRIAACLLGLGRFVETIRIRLLPYGVDVWIRPGTADVVTLAQVWNWRQYDLPIPAPPTIVDGGANIGLSAVFFALKWPGSRIVAVEPEPGNFALLERNVRSFSNVGTVRAALWGSSEPLVVVNPEARENMYQVEPGLGRESVRGITVPELCEAEGWDRIGLLKLDIEGAELEVLRSSVPWIDRVDVLAVELHDRERTGCTEAFRDATVGFDQHSTKGELDVAWRVEAP
jgi:FkbM family methyltransferase